MPKVLYIIFIFTAFCRTAAIAMPVVQPGCTECAWQDPENSTEDPETEKVKQDFKEEMWMAQEPQPGYWKIRAQNPTLSDNRLIWHTRQPPTPPPNDGN